MAHIDAFYTDQSLRTIDSTTFKVDGQSKDNEKWMCTKRGFTKRGYLSGTESAGITDDDEFPIVLSHGEGPIVHRDLIQKCPVDLRSPVTNWAGGDRFTMPTAQDPGRMLTIIGETYVMFFMQDILGVDWWRFRVKALVTTSELPLFEPKYSRGTQPLMWIGVGEDEAKSLFRPRQHPVDGNEVHVLGYTANPDSQDGPELF